MAMTESQETTASSAVESGSSLLTPEVQRRIDENRQRARAIRQRLDETQSSSPAEPQIITRSVLSVSRKRGYDATVEGAARSARVTRSMDSSIDANSHRDGRKAEEPAVRPARHLAKYVDYNMSAMTDTKGGFMTTDDDPHNRALVGRNTGDQGGKPKNMTAQEWDRLQTLRNLQRLKAGPFEPGLSVLDDAEAQERHRCRECGSREIDFVWEEVFDTCVCQTCKDKFPDKYSLLTKTECKEDYLLTEPELRDEELLPHLNKPNPHKTHWHDMMLFLRYQVEEYAIQHKWGSEEALDAEFVRREADKKRRKEAKFKAKLQELKRKTLTDAYRRQARGEDAEFGDTIRRTLGNSKHVHAWSRPVGREDGTMVKKCSDCGMEVEEMEL